MAIEDAAQVAVTLWNRDDAIVMTAIAGPESGFRLGAAGDDAATLAALYNDPLYLTWQCNGYCGYGPWQENLRWHYPALAAFSGSQDPCGMAAWLTASWANAARGAREVFENQGFSAWTTYTGGQYQSYLADATAAVGAALAPPPPPPPPPPPAPVPVGLIALLGCANGQAVLKYGFAIGDGLPTYLFISRNADFSTQDFFLGPYYAAGGLIVTPPSAGVWYAQLNRYAPVGNAVQLNVPAISCGPQPVPSPMPTPMTLPGGSPLFVGVLIAGAWYYAWRTGRVKVPW